VHATQPDAVILTSDLSRAEQVALLESETSELSGKTAAFEVRSGISAASAGTHLLDIADVVRRGADWFMSNIVEDHRDRVLPTPLWWDDSFGTSECPGHPEWNGEATPFTSWQLRLIDEFQAWYWLALEAALPSAKRAVWGGSRSDFRTGRPALRVGAKAYVDGRVPVYTWSLRLIQGQNLDTRFMLDHFDYALELAGK